MGNLIIALSGSSLEETFTGSSVAHTSAGVTYNFSGDVTYGYYANGEPFVVSGSDVTITSITPAGTTGARDKNGTVVQPTVDDRQDFDSEILGYTAANNLDPGKTGSNLVISAATYPTGASVVKAVSNDTKVGRSWIKRYSVLTIVPTTPPAGAFRPPVYGTDKVSYYTESDINYDKLQSVAPVTGQPTVEDYSYFTEAVLDSWATGGSVNRDARPTDYHDDYDPNQKGDLAAGLCALHTNISNAAKKPLLVSMIQMGIDYCGGAVNGHIYSPGSAHSDAYKLPAVVAAVVLDKAALKTASATAGAFREEEDIITIAVGNVGTDYHQTSNNSEPPGTGAFYRTEHVGFAEWWNEPTWKNPLVTAGYRFIYAGKTVQAALAVEMLGNGEGRTVFAHEPVFRYAARVQEWFNVDITIGTANTQPAWANLFAETYGPTYSDDIAVAAQAPEAPYDLTLVPSSTSATCTIDGVACIGTGTLTQIDVRWSTDRSTWTTITDFTNGGTITGLPSSSVIYVQARYVTSVGTGPWSTNQIIAANGTAQPSGVNYSGVIGALATAGFIDPDDGSFDDSTYMKSAAFRTACENIYEAAAGYEALCADLCQGVTRTTA